jgi:hypothetical protein
MIDLLKGDNSARLGGAKLLSMLSRQGIYYFTSSKVSQTSIAAKFQRFIGTCIPQIIDLCKDASSDVRTEGARLLTTLSEHGMSCIWPGMIVIDKHCSRAAPGHCTYQSAP